MTFDELIELVLADVSTPEKARTWLGESLSRLVDACADEGHRPRSGSSCAICRALDKMLAVQP